jgi:hypothetical protein
LVSGWGLALEDLKRGLDAENGELVCVLISGGNDPAITQHRMNGANVVKANHQDRTCFPCGLDSGDGS